MWITKNISSMDSVNYLHSHINSIWIMNWMVCMSISRGVILVFSFNPSTIKEINRNNKFTFKYITRIWCTVVLLFHAHWSWGFTKQKKSLHSWDICFYICQTSMVMEWESKTWGNWGKKYFLTILSLKLGVDGICRPTKLAHETPGTCLVIASS